MLDKKQYNIIKIDEFGLSSRKFMSMDEKNKGSGSKKSHIDDGFNIGVIIAFLDKRIYGVMYGNVSTGSSILMHFLSLL